MEMATPPEDHHQHGPMSPPPLSPPPEHGGGSSNSLRTVPVILPVILLLFFLLGFFSVYLFRYLSSTWLSCCLRRSSSSSSSSSAANSALPAGPQPRSNRGLDPAILASFPTFPYNAVRGLREGKPGLECAVCLAEFASGDAVRLLALCCHVFHPACIDAWLARHKTCPVCRADLEVPPDAAAVIAVHQTLEGGTRDSHAIYIDEEDGRRRSTEESIVDVEDDDRYTLRLNEAAEQHLAAYHMRAQTR